MLNNHQTRFVFWILLFRVLLELSYVNVIVNVFAYAKFIVDFSFLNYFISWVVLLSCFFFVRSRANNISDIFFVNALLGVMVPLTVLYGYDSNREAFPVLVSLAAIFIVHLVISTKSISFRNLPTIKYGTRYAVIASVIFVIFLVVWYFISGVNFNLDLEKVYEYRMANHNIAALGLLSYTNNWTFKIFNIFLLVMALRYSKFSLVVLILLVQIYFYAASAHKAVLFTPLVIFGVWFYFKKSNSLVFIPAIFSLLVLCTLITYYVIDDIVLSSYFSRRLFFVPANITYAYFEFFNHNSYIMWSNSILSSFQQYPYDLPMVHLIGRFLGEPNMAANNGFVSSGYAHAGLFGVFFYSIIIGFILKFINHTTFNLLPVWFSIALCILPIRNLLISSDLFTVLLTHGFIIALILIYITRSNNYASLKK